MIPEEGEIIAAIWQMKTNKVLGEDDTVAELFKYGGGEFESHFVNMIKEVWVNEEMPDDWKSAIVQPIRKKGDKAVYDNYRGITLLNVAYKVVQD